MNPRRAIQDIDANARVIRERRQLGRAAGMTCLGKRILDEAKMRLERFRYVELRLRYGLNRQRREDRLDLTEFAWIA